MQPKTLRRTRWLAAGSLTAVAFALAFVPFNMGGCAVDPNNIDVNAVWQGGVKVFQAQTLSTKDEDAIGQAVALQATNRWPIDQDQSLNRYVTLVCRTIAASSAEPWIKPNCAVLNTMEVNAFSGPHGYVFITRGALMQMHNESELAGVLAHEVGHLCKHHGLNAVKSAGTMQGLVAAAKGTDSRVQQFGNVADGASQAIINVGFSEPQEEEADSEGVKYMIAAGYDPNGFLHFLQRIRKEQGQGGQTPFGTHPGIGDRIKKVRAQIAQSGAGGTGARLEDRFAQNVVTQ